MTRFIHPLSGIPVFGELLKPGDELKEGDVYPSSSGQWQNCPVLGLKIQPGCTTIWVRPEMTNELHMLCIDHIHLCDSNQVGCSGCGG